MSDSISLRGQAAVFDPVANGPVAITGSIVENTATQDETKMTVQAQPLAETSEVPGQEPSHSACSHPGCKRNGDDITVE